MTVVRRLNDDSVTSRPARGSVRDVATGVSRIARGLVPLRRATPRRLVRIAGSISSYGLTLGGLARVASIRDGRDVVLVDRAGPVTADQLDRWSATVAGELTRRELVAPGGRLGVLCRSGRGFLIAAVAASRIGADVVLLHPSYRSDELRDVIRAQDLRIVVHDEELSDLLAAAGFRGRGILADASAPGLLSLPSMAALPQVDVPAPVRPGRIVLLSSGRGGRPRGAYRSPPGASSSQPVTSMLRRLDTRRGSPLMILPPLHHPLGVGFMTVALGLGCRTVVRPRFDPAETLALLEEHAVETLVTLPRMLLRLTEELGDRPPPPSLRAIVSGGGPLHPSLWRRATDAFGPVVHNVYGSVGTGWCALATPTELATAPGTIGRPAAGVEISIVGDDGEPAPVGVLGRVLVSSPAAALNRTDVHARHGQPVDTRDIGHRDHHGRLFVDARAGNVIVVDDQRIAPSAVEDTLLDHPAVADAAVAGQSGRRPGDPADARIVARVVLRAKRDQAGDADAVVEELRARLAERFGAAGSAAEVRIVSAIALTDTGQPLPLD